ncbi:MAG: LamG domain-containing protein [Planctomycetes bacterium]|nr:LamG domain-containing protein [Planctomycetota bacterium]
MASLSSLRLATTLALTIFTAAASAQYTPRALLVGDNSVLRIPAHPSLEPTTGLTIECWIKPTGSISHGRIVRKSGDFRPGYQLNFSFQGNQVGADLYVGGITYRVDDPLNNGRLLGTWHHLAVTVQPGAQMHLYVDGVRIASNMAPPVLDHSDALVIGGLYLSPTNIQEEYVGLVDELRIWGVARSAQEIAEHRFRYTMRGAGLISAWHFDTDTRDSIGTNHGTLIGGASLVPSDAPIGGGFTASSDRGRWSGGGTVDLTGDFPEGILPDTLWFGEAPSPSYAYVAPNVLRATIPPGPAGTAVTMVARFESFELVSSHTYLYLPRLEIPLSVRIGTTFPLRLAIPPPGYTIVFAGLPPAIRVPIPGLDGVLGIQPPFVEILSTPVPFSSLEMPIAVPPDAGLVGAEILVQALFTASASPLVGTFVNLELLRITS